MQPGFLHLSFLLHMVGALRTPPPAGPSMLTGQWLMMKPTAFVQVRHYILRQAPPTTLDPVVQHVHHASSIGIDIITSRSPNNQHTREGFIIADWTFITIERSTAHPKTKTVSKTEAFQNASLGLSPSEFRMSRCVVYGTILLTATVTRHTASINFRLKP